MMGTTPGFVEFLKQTELRKFRGKQIKMLVGFKAFGSVKTTIFALLL